MVLQHIHVCFLVFAIILAYPVMAQELDTAADSSTSQPLSDVSLDVRPVRCVTLREGQPCYVRLAVSWKSLEPISACLTSEQNEAQACWDNAVTGDFNANLYLSESTEWVLLDQSGADLGSVAVTVAWVYKSRRVRRRWRLF